MSSNEFQTFRQNIVEKLNNNALVLPTPPRVAMKVQSELKENPDIDANQVAKLILKDPAMSASVIKAANVAHISRQQKVRTLPHAVARIGIHRIRSLLFKFAMEQMFLTNDQFAAKKLKATWNCSLDIAVKSLAFIATHPDRNVVRHLDPDVMTLIAISHRIGLLPIYVELSNDKYDKTDNEFVRSCEVKLNAGLTKKILSSWNMDIEIINGATGWQNVEPVNSPLTYAELIKLVSIQGGYFPGSKALSESIWAESIKSNIIPNEKFFSDTEFVTEAENIRSYLA